MKKLIPILLILSALLLTACTPYYSGYMEMPKLSEPPLTEEKRIYTTDTTVTVDGIPMEALEIDGETVIALEDLTKCDFEEDHRFDGEAFDMIAGYSYEYEGNEIEPQTGGAVLGSTTPSRDIVRVNGVKIDNDLFNDKHYVSVEKLGELDDPYNEEWGYSDYNMKLTSNGNEKQLECFRFPPVDYGARLAEAEPMVSAPEVDIYTEGNASETVHFGGKNEPETGVYAGIVGDGNGGAFKGDTPTFDHDFGVYSSYLEFDYMQDEIYMPNKKIVKKKDCVMLVPWNIEDVTRVFDENYQDYIYKTLDKLKKYNRPIILRFGAEMNIGNLGNSPSAYVKAFRYIADIVHEYGFAVMWSPNDMSSLNRTYSYYYPGDEYVDWIGISAFMRKDFMNTAPTAEGDAMLFNCGDYAYHTNSVKRIVRFMEENNIKKPLAISEGGVISTANYADAPSEYSTWAHERLGNMYWYLPMRYPQVKMITYFNHTTRGEAIGYWLKDKPDYIPIVDEALQNAPYLLSGSDKADFAFVRADGREYTDSEIPIYTYLYIPSEGGHKVEYALDGEVIDTKMQIPYKTTLHESGITEGEHKLSIIADGEVMREYMVTKENGTIKIIGG